MHSETNYIRCCVFSGLGKEDGTVSGDCKDGTRWYCRWCSSGKCSFGPMEPCRNSPIRSFNSFPYFNYQARADRIQSDIEELVKSLNERCKSYGLRAKPITLSELPFGMSFVLGY